MPLTIGQVLHNRYRVDALLASGGMGAVYRCTDLTFGTTVAVKENWMLTAGSIRQFAREAALLNRLPHPNLPRVIDHFSEGQGQYLVMDFVPGEDLDQLVARTGPIAESQALAWAGKVLDALEYLHGQNPPVIHRDVKPANVKITPRGEVYLVDFGLAKEYDPARPTSAGGRGATPGYAPPEQYGVGRTDARSDLYSLAATLYTLLTGREPADAVDRLAGTAALMPPRALNPAISPHVEAAILRAMQLEPRDRFQTTGELRQALMPATVLAVPTARSAAAPAFPPPPPGTWPVPAQPPGPVKSSQGRRQRAWFWGFFVAACTLLIAGAVLVHALNRGFFTSSRTPSRSATPASAGALDNAGRIALAMTLEGQSEVVVYSIKPDGTWPTLLGTTGSSGCPRWSPDGTRIAFGCYGAVCIVSVDTSEAKAFAFGGEPTAWSPDGQRILTSDGLVVRARDADGSGGPDIPGSGGARVANPLWSPVSDRILFSEVDAYGWINLFVTDPNGQNRVRVNARLLAAEDGFAWSPDGRQIAYLDEDSTLRIVKLDGTEEAAIQGCSRITRHLWSPDGTRIACWGGGNEIRVMNADGSNLIELAIGRDVRPFLQWSPAGTYLAFVARAIDPYRGQPTPEGGLTSPVGGATVLSVVTPTLILPTLSTTVVPATAQSATEATAWAQATATAQAGATATAQAGATATAQAIAEATTQAEAIATAYTAAAATATALFQEHTWGVYVVNADASGGPIRLTDTTMEVYSFDWTATE